MRLALERSKTAREAVKVITYLADTYGYGSEGESFSITDTEEAWILEMVGTGDGGEGAIWVAMKIPDGMISCHANKARIGTFPLDDPENCLYSYNVISFAIEHGYYDPESGEPFEFNEVYCPSTPSNLRYCSSRVWSILNRAAPSLTLSIDYNRGVPGAERYPLWVKPDKKPGVGDIKKFSWDSAWWVFNFVGNYCNIRYADMVKEVQIIQDSLENQFIDYQDIIDKIALILLEENKDRAVDFLTEYAETETNYVMKTWIKLGEHLITKYNDGYVKNENGQPVEEGYPEFYLREVLKNRESVKLPVWEE